MQAKRGKIGEFSEKYKKSVPSTLFLFHFVRDALAVGRERVANILPRKAAPLQKGDRLVNLLAVGHIACLLYTSRCV